jgi:hypothetical protein
MGPRRGAASSQHPSIEREVIFYCFWLLRIEAVNISLPYLKCFSCCTYKHANDLARDKAERMKRMLLLALTMSAVVLHADAWAVAPGIEIRQSLMGDALIQWPCEKWGRRTLQRACTRGQEKGVVWKIQRCAGARMRSLSDEKCS